MAVRAGGAALAGGGAFVTAAGGGATGGATGGALGAATVVSEAAGVVGAAVLRARIAKIETAAASPIPAPMSMG